MFSEGPGVFWFLEPPKKIEEHEETSDQKIFVGFFAVLLFCGLTPFFAIAIFVFVAFGTGLDGYHD